MKCPNCPNEAQMEGLCWPHYLAEHPSDNPNDSLESIAADIMTMGKTRGAAAIVALVQQGMSVVEESYEETITDLEVKLRPTRRHTAMVSPIRTLKP